MSMPEWINDGKVRCSFCKTALKNNHLHVCWVTDNPGWKMKELHRKDIRIPEKK